MTRSRTFSDSNCLIITGIYFLIILSGRTGFAKSPARDLAELVHKMVIPSPMYLSPEFDCAKSSILELKPLTSNLRIVSEINCQAKDPAWIVLEALNQLINGNDQKFENLLFSKNIILLANLAVYYHHYEKFEKLKSLGEQILGEYHLFDTHPGIDTNDLPETGYLCLMIANYELKNSDKSSEYYRMIRHYNFGDSTIQEIFDYYAPRVRSSGGRLLR